MVVPQIGLVINDFAAGVEFFKTLPSIEDPFALRSLRVPAADGADGRRNGCSRSSSRSRCRRRRSPSTPSTSGFAAAFTSPMVITGSARIYSIFTSQAVFNGQVVVKISTDGKLLIIGKLNFAQDNISISGRLYADLSKVATGNVVVLFLADFPDQVRLLTIYGKLKMGFRDSSGNEVAFDVVDGVDPVATGTAPTIDLGAPTTNGGTIDYGVVNGDERLDEVPRHLVPAAGRREPRPHAGS